MKNAGTEDMVLIYVEDPGAANMAAALPGPLTACGLRARLTAAAGGARQLERLGASPEPAGGIAWDESRAPAVLVIGTSEDPDSIAFDLIEKARRTACATVGLVDGAASAARRFRGRTDQPLALAPDWLIVPDAETGAAYTELGYDGAHILVSGHPHFDHVRAESARLAQEGRAAVRRRLLPGMPESDPIIAFLAEISDGLEPADFKRSRDYTLAGRGGSDKRTDIVLEEVLDAIASLEPKPRLVLRLHPKNAHEEFAAYHDEIDRVSSDEPALDLVYACDAVVGMTSSLLIEAAHLGLPVLSVTPRRSERTWLGSAASVIPCVHTREALAGALSEALAGTRPDGDALDRLYPPGAAQRIAEFVAERAKDRAVWQKSCTEGTRRWGAGR